MPWYFILIVPALMCTVMCAIADIWPDELMWFHRQVIRIPGLQRSWDVYYRTVMRLARWAVRGAQR